MNAQHAVEIGHSGPLKSRLSFIIQELEALILDHKRAMDYLDDEAGIERESNDDVNLDYCLDLAHTKLSEAHQYTAFCSLK